MEQLGRWQGDYPLDSVPATVFSEFLYDLTYAAMHDELGDAMFDTLLSTRELDTALPRLAADANSPWWTDRASAAHATRADIVKLAWGNALRQLKATLGDDPGQWQWGKAHTLTHEHPLGSQKPLDRLFNIGPFAAPGSHEVPNNLSGRLGPAPWHVSYGPSTRRVIDFADPAHATTINPVGQSGVLFDAHYNDQAQDYIDGKYHQVLIDPADVANGTVSTLNLVPAR